MEEKTKQNIEKISESILDELLLGALTVGLTTLCLWLIGIGWLSAFKWGAFFFLSGRYGAYFVVYHIMSSYNRAKYSTYKDWEDKLGK